MSNADKLAGKTSSSTIQVLLVDDQAIIAEGIRRMLEVEKDIKLHYCAEPGKAMTQLLIGVLVTAAIFLIAAKLAGAAPWLAAVIAGSVGGALQPYLFKDLRYR